MPPQPVTELIATPHGVELEWFVTGEAPPVTVFAHGLGSSIAETRPLSKLKRWTDQVRQRDYFGESSYAAVQALLQRCERALETFLDQASEEVEAG